MNKKISWLGVLILVWASPAAFAIPIPPAMKTRLLQMKRGDLVRRFEAIPEITPRQFISKFMRAGPQQLIDAGTEGFIVKDSEGSAWKFSLAIAQALGLAEIQPVNNKITPAQLTRLTSEWKELGDDLVVQASLRRVLPERKDWPLKNAPLTHEILGSLLWSAYYGGEVNIPSAVSSDGFAYQGKFVEGMPLSEVLIQDRSRNPQFDLRKVWQGFASLQRINEKMLVETGYAVDILSPSNIIVTGSFDEPVLVPVDNSLARPQPDVAAWFKKKGIELGDIGLDEDLQPFVNPVVSVLIVSHKMWGLTFDQAVAYVQAYFGILSRTQAIHRLADIKRWENEKYPWIMDHGNILAARSYARLSDERRKEGKLKHNLNVDALSAICVRVAQRGD